MKDLKQIIFEETSNQIRLIRTFDKELESGNIPIDEAKRQADIHSIIHSELILIIIEARLSEEYDKWREENN